MRCLAAALAAAAVFAALPAAAQSWPTKPVRLIVPYAAGGSTDNAARAFTEQLSTSLGQQFVIENKGGAGGGIGLEAAAKSPADGYTFVVQPLATLVILPHARKLPYDPLKDFAYVGRIAYGTLVFAVAPTLANSLQEFVALAKANPGKYTYASSGIGAMPHITFEVMKQVAGIDAVHVPHRGGADAIQGFLGGHVDAVGESNIMPHAKSGKAKLLAVIDEVRHPEFPDVPTMAEALPGYDVNNWFGIAGPAGTAPEIVQKLSAELNRIAAMPEVQARMIPLGLRAVGDTPAAMEADVRKQHARYAELIRRLDIKME